MSNPGSSQFLGPARQTEDSFAAFVEKVEGWDIPALPHMVSGDTFTPAHWGAEAGHFGGMKRWWGSADKETQIAFLAKLRRLWELHDEGLSSRQIARELGWKSHNSVLHHLR